MIRTASLPAALLGLVAVIGMAALISVWGESQSATAEKLIQQEPHAGDTVAELPHQLLLTFDRPLALLVGAHTVTVTDSEGHELNDGPAQIATYSARTLVVPLEGEVQDAADISVSLSVRFEDSDGELFALDESYGFRVDPSLSESELAGEAAAGEEAPTERSSQSLVLWTVAILIGIAVVGGLLYFMRVATGTSRSSLEPTNRSVFRD